jgi:hypothetical protein
MADNSLGRERKSIEVNMFSYILFLKIFLRKTNNNKKVFVYVLLNKDVLVFCVKLPDVSDRDFTLAHAFVSVSPTSPR